MFFVESVAGYCAFDVWGDITSHVEALHGCGCCGSWPVVSVEMVLKGRLKMKGGRYLWWRYVTA